MRFAQCVLGAFATTAVLVSANAHGQTSGGDKVTAEALFEDARKLVADGKIAEACPKFADSERLDPSAATLLNLASCWEKLGRTATAWATYKEAASVANAAGRRDYLAAADRHADSLAPTLSHLTLTVSTPVDGIQVRRDDVNVDRAEWGTTIPIDPGIHALSARAPGYKDWSTQIDVAPSGAPVTVTVPALEAAPLAPAIAPAVAPAPATTAPPIEQETHESNGSTQRLAGWILGGAGLVGIAVGAGFAAAAKGKDNDSIKDCDANDPNLCDPTGLSERSDARSEGDVATVFIIAGGAAVAGGVVLWLTAPSAKKRETGQNLTLAIAPTLGGALLKGTW